MKSFSSWTRSSPRRAGVGSLALRALLLLVGCGAMSAALASGGPQPRFQLTGSGTLNRDQSVLKNESILLKATLTPNDEAPAPSSPLHTGGRFAVTAALSVSSLVCYNDTIFRDGFDGTGF